MKSTSGLSVDWPLPFDDPYPVLTKLRNSAPVHWVPELQSYLVVSYQAALSVLQNPQVWSSDIRNSELLVRMGLSAETANAITTTLLFSDGAEHTRLRQGLRGYLTPNAVEDMRPRIRQIVATALGGNVTEEPLEVMNILAYPVPLAVICELCDVPVEMASVLREDTPRMVAMLDPLASQPEVEEGLSAMVGTMLELVPIVADRRVRPGNDLLSALCMSDSGLAADETIAMMLLLLAAGHETTANLVGNAVVALHKHPDVAHQLRYHPEMLSAAVDEFLRYDSPVQLTARVATTDTEIAGQHVRAHQQVFISLSSANRDPDVFANASEIRLDRVRNRHIAFGHGAHFCAGASLARCEAEEMLRQILLVNPPIEDRELVVERGKSASFRRLLQLDLLSAGQP